MSEKAPTQAEQPANLKSFSIINAENTIFTVEPRDYFATCEKHGIIYKVKRRSMFSENGEFTDYGLRETVEGEDFIFRIIKSFGYGDGVYTLDFISEKYSYALMGFKREEVQKLEETILSFIQTILTADESIKTLRYSGAPSSYSKNDVDDAKALLAQKGYENHRDLDSLRPSEVRDELYRHDIKGTNLQEANNDYRHKRDDVFTYRLRKLFLKNKLPYSIRKDEMLSDVFIEKIKG
jgi:hypothetical protein